MARIHHDTSIRRTSRSARQRMRPKTGRDATVRDALLRLASVLERAAVELDHDLEASLSARRSALKAREAAGLGSVELATRVLWQCRTLLSPWPSRMSPRTAALLHEAGASLAGMLGITWRIPADRTYRLKGPNGGDSPRR